MLTMVDCLHQGAKPATKLAIHGKPLRIKVAAFTRAHLENFTQQSRAKINCRPNVHPTCMENCFLMGLGCTYIAHMRKRTKHAMEALQLGHSLAQCFRHPELNHLQAFCTRMAGHLQQCSSAADLPAPAQAAPI